MRKLSRTGLAAVLTATAATLTSSAGVAAILAGSAGNGDVSLAATARWAPALPAKAKPAGPALSRPASASPAPSPTLPSVLAAKGPGSGSRALAKVTEKPAPVVGGVPRTNVRSAHSPQLARQLSGSPTTPPPAGAGALGIDVADYQHPHGAAINWPQVAAAGYKFAFIKGTEGNYYSNPYAATDLAQAKAAGLNVADYHFAVPNVSSGASQAEYAVASSDYTANGHTLPLALDIEYNPYGAECYGLSHARMVSWVSAFSGEVRHLTGQLPVIYTTADWWRTCTGDSTALGSDPLWVAGYGSASPPMPAGWPKWTFWQFTSGGHVPGITGNVDLSYFLSSGARLLPTGIQQAAVTPKRPSPPRSPAPAPRPSSPAHSPAPSPSPSHSTPPPPASPSPSPTSPSPSPTSPSPSSPPPSSQASPSPTGSPSPTATPSAPVN